MEKESKMKINTPLYTFHPERPFAEEEYIQERMDRLSSIRDDASDDNIDEIKSREVRAYDLSSPGIREMEQKRIEQSIREKRQREEAVSLARIAELKEEKVKATGKETEKYEVDVKTLSEVKEDHTVREIDPEDSEKSFHIFLVMGILTIILAVTVGFVTRSDLWVGIVGFSCLIISILTHSILNRFVFSTEITYTVHPDHEFLNDLFVNEKDEAHRRYDDLNIEKSTLDTLVFDRPEGFKEISPDHPEYEMYENACMSARQDSKMFNRLLNIIVLREEQRQINYKIERFKKISAANNKPYKPLTFKLDEEYARLGKVIEEEQNRLNAEGLEFQRIITSAQERGDI